MGGLHAIKYPHPDYTNRLGVFKKTLASYQEKLKTLKEQKVASAPQMEERERSHAIHSDPDSDVAAINPSGAAASASDKPLSEDKDAIEVLLPAEEDPTIRRCIDLYKLLETNPKPSKKKAYLEWLDKAAEVFKDNNPKLVLVSKHDLESRKTAYSWYSETSNGEPGTWYVDGINDCIVRRESDGDNIEAIAWLSKSFGGKKRILHKGIGYRRCNVFKKRELDETEVFVHFVAKGLHNKFSNRYFDPTTGLDCFLRTVSNVLETYSETVANEKYSRKHPNCASRALEKLTNSDYQDWNHWKWNTDDRRRMAQRTHSSRRDSPVMVRLLQEIVAAQDK